MCVSYSDEDRFIIGLGDVGVAKMLEDMKCPTDVEHSEVAHRKQDASKLSCCLIRLSKPQYNDRRLILWSHDIQDFLFLH